MQRCREAEKQRENEKRTVIRKSGFLIYDNLVV